MLFPLRYRDSCQRHFDATETGWAWHEELIESWDIFQKTCKSFHKFYVWAMAIECGLNVTEAARSLSLSLPDSVRERTKFRFLSHTDSQE